MNESFFQFHSPQFFLLGFLLIPLFIFDLSKLHIVKFRAGSQKVYDQKLSRSWRSFFEFIPPTLRFLGFVLLLIGLARPQWGKQYQEIESEGVDIVLALDTSGSMRALDMELDGQRVNRMQVVKAVVTDFIAGRRHDRLGMVIFGSQAYTQCPLTLDYDMLAGYLDLIDIGIVGEETAIGNAIALSVKRLMSSQAKSKVIILLTDGENTAGEISPLKAAEVAADEGVKIYTIAVGTTGPVPMPVQTFFGQQIVNINLEVDEESLKQIATTTQGQFFLAKDTAALRKIYETIDKLEKTKVEVKEFVDYGEDFLRYVVPALILFLTAWVLQRTVFLRVP